MVTGRLSGVYSRYKSSEGPSGDRSSSPSARGEKGGGGGKESVKSSSPCLSRYLGVRSLYFIQALLPCVS